MNEELNLTPVFCLFFFNKASDKLNGCSSNVGVFYLYVLCKRIAVYICNVILFDLTQFLILGFISLISTT